MKTNIKKKSKPRKNYYIPKKLPIPDDLKKLLRNPDNIVYIKVCGRNVTLVLKVGCKQIFVIQFYKVVPWLSMLKFYKTNRSYIINRSCVCGKKLVKGKWMVILDNTHLVPVDDNKIKTIENILLHIRCKQQLKDLFHPPIPNEEPDE